jgi:hypothetical protein
MRLKELQQRQRRPEIMDQPGLERGRHLQALAGLARLNSWSGSVRILWPQIRRQLERGNARPLRILDLASGAGDVPLGIWKRAARAGWTVTVEGWDISSIAVNHARQRAAGAGAPLQFHVADALSAPGDQSFDVVMCSLFLHHLDESQAADLLGRMVHLSKRLVLVNDLVRSVSGYLLAYAATRLLTASDIVHADGPQSVAGAFCLEEVEVLARRAGMTGARIERRWPCRFLLSWEPPRA